MRVIEQQQFIYKAYTVAVIHNIILRCPDVYCTVYMDVVLERSYRRHSMPSSQRMSIRQKVIKMSIKVAQRYIIIQARYKLLTGVLH